MTSEQLALSVAATAAVAGIALAKRHDDALDAAVELRFGRDLKSAQVENFLAATVSGSGRWRLALEVHATSRSITHRLRFAAARQSVVLGQLRAHVSGLRVEKLDDPLDAASYGFAAVQEFTLIGELGMLNVSDPQTVATALLASLALPGKGERLVLQWVLAPQHTDALRERMTADMRRTLHPIRAVPDRKGVEEKRTAARFQAILRIGAMADTPDRAKRLIAHAAAPLGIVRTPASHFRPAGSGATAANALFAARPSGLLSGGVLSVEEMVGLLGWPIGSPQIPRLHIGTSRQLPPSPDISSKGVLIGTSTMTGSTRRLCLTKAGLRQHLGITAPTGTGKSTLLGTMALDAIAEGIGVVVVDWKGDLITALIDRIPADRIGDVIVLDPSDPQSVVGLPNPLLGEPHERDLLLDGLVGWLGRSWDSSWGPRTASVVQASLFTLARAGGSALIDLPELLTNPALRSRVLSRVDDLSGLDGFWSNFEEMSEAERAQVIAPTLNRTRPWLLRKDVRHVLGQTDPRFSLDEVLDGKVLLVNLAAGRLGEETARLLGSILVGQLSAAIMRRSRMAESKRKTALVMLDEFHFIAGLAGDFEQTLAMARGLGIGFVVAHQHLGQLDLRLRQAVLANVRSRVAFQLGHKDAEAIAKEFGAQVKGSDLQHLAAYEAIARLATPNGVSAPVSLRTEPLPASTGSRAEVIKSSRTKYGRRRDDVEKLIAERHSRTSAQGAIGRKPRPTGGDR